jgi:hypothetical protein
MAEDRLSESAVRGMIPGIKGWLLVYCIGPLGIGTLMLIGAASSSGESLFLFLVGLNIYLLVITIYDRRPLTRIINIWVNGIFTVLIFVALDAETAAADLGGAIGASIWFFYWIYSDRVKITYSVVTV